MFKYAYSIIGTALKKDIRFLVIVKHYIHTKHFQTTGIQQIGFQKRYFDERRHFLVAKREG